MPGSDEMRSYTVWNTLALGLKLKALGEALYALRGPPGLDGGGTAGIPRF